MVGEYFILDGSIAYQLFLWLAPRPLAAARPCVPGIRRTIARTTRKDVTIILRIGGGNCIDDSLFRVHVSYHFGLLLAQDKIDRSQPHSVHDV